MVAMAAPRSRSLVLGTAALVAAGASAPAFAQSPLGDLAIGFVTGASVAVAGTMVVAWLVLRDRVARRASWVPYVVVSVLLMVVGAWRAGQQAAWLVLAGLGVLAWGLVLIFWLARRMLRLLEEGKVPETARIQAPNDLVWLQPAQALHRLRRGDG